MIIGFHVQNHTNWTEFVFVCLTHIQLELASCLNHSKDDTESVIVDIEPLYERVVWWNGQTFEI